MQRKLQEAIVKTLIYSDIFDYPLTGGELVDYLIEYKLSQDEKSALFSFGGALSDSLFEWNSGFFHLHDRGETIVRRRERQRSAESKLEKAKGLSWVFKFFPWIRLVAITGAVAAGNPGADSDIDLLVVADGRRIWLSRFLVLGFLQALNQRVNVGKGKLKDRFCVNIFLPTENLTYPNQDLFAANELARMRVIFDRGNYYQKLIEVNQWVERWLPNWEGNAKLKFLPAQAGKVENFLDHLKSVIGNSLVIPASSLILDRLEEWLKNWQIGRIQKNFPRAQDLSPLQLLIFQPNDVKEKILMEYQRRLKSLAPIAD